MEQIPECLSSDVISKEAVYAGVADAVPDLLKAAECIANNSEFCRNFKEMMHELQAPVLEMGFDNWPFPADMPVELRDLAVCLAAVGITPRGREFYRAKGIPEDIIEATLKRLTVVNDFHREITGRHGMYPASLAWQRNHFRDPLIYSLGRFNYRIIAPLGLGVLLKRRSDGKRLMLAGDNWAIDRENLRTIGDGEVVFTTTLSEEKGTWTGYPVTPYGKVLDQQITCPAEEFEVLLQPGDKMLDLHIPGGGGMTPERCIDSFRKAFAFFETYYPADFKKVIYSSSWIFNPAFEKRLPECNMAKFMRETWLFPQSSTGADGYYFLFGTKTPDVANAPRDTTLRRTMLDILESGEKLRQGGMFLLKEDLPYWGTQRNRQLSII